MLVRTVAVVGLLFVCSCGAYDPADEGAVSSEASGDGHEEASDFEIEYGKFVENLRPIDDGLLYEGDIFIPNDVDLRSFWETFVWQAPDRFGLEKEQVVPESSQVGEVRTKEAALSLGTSGIQSDRNLSYCILTTGSTGLTSAQVAATANRLAQAGNEWKTWTNTSFTYVPNENATCTATNTRVDFHVRLLTSSEIQASPTLQASSFFPGYARANRVLKINPSQIADSSAFRGLLIHELGHTLGFIHEHAQNSTTGCADNDADHATQLSRYDSASVMHYDWCNGTRSTSLSTYDALGAACGYLGSCEWSRVTGEALDIAAGGSAVWIIGANRIPYRFRASNSTWDQMPGTNGDRIAVDASGVAWMVNTNKNIYRFGGGSWTQMPGTALDIAAGASGVVWIVGENRKMYSYVSSPSGWSQMAAGSDGNRITVDSSGNPWIVTTTNKIYRRAGNGWTLVTGTATDIAASSNGRIWLVGTTAASGGYTLYEFRPSTGGADAPGWTQITGSGRNIAATSSGKPWLVNSSKQIYRNNWEG